MCLIEVLQRSLINPSPSPSQLSKHAKSVPVCSGGKVCQRCHEERKITACHESTHYTVSAGGWADVALGTLLSVS